MASSTGFNEAIGTFIDAWAGNVIEPNNPTYPLLSSAPFREGKTMGGTFHWPMRATVEGGITVTAPTLEPGSSGLPYVGARNGYIPDWKIDAPQYDGRSRVRYEAVARSASSVDSSTTDRKKAVRSATSLVVDGLLQSAFRRAEAWMLHGRRGIGQIQATSEVVAASTVAGNPNANPFDGNAAGFVIDVELSASSWAEGIWIQSEGSTFDFYSNSGGDPTSTKLNTSANGVLTAGTNQTGAVLLMVGLTSGLNTGLSTTSGRVLRFFHTIGTAGGSGVGFFGSATTGTFAAYQTAHIFYESGSITSEPVSLTGMARNTGTLFGVSGATYSVARGNTNDGVANLKMGGLIRALSSPINKGAKGKNIRAVVPTELFAQLSNDEAVLRRYIDRDKTARNFFSGLLMELPHGGTLEILGHTMQKAGEVLCYVPEEVIRVGSQDIDFIRRGQGRDAFILEVAQSPSSEMRLFGQFAPLAESPSHMLSMTSLTY